MRPLYVIGVVCLVAVALLYVFMRMPIVNMKTVRNLQAKQDATYLAFACNAYRMEYGVFPAASEQRDILRILEKDNERHIAFIERTEKNTSAKGTFDDPWGTPYVFDFRDLSTPTVLSAGPDHQPHTDDDVSNL